MTRPSVPDPDDHDALSSWEQRVLAAIEDDLAAGDPRLAQRLRGRRTATRWWPLSVRSTALLFVALVVLVLAGTLLSASWVGLGLVTTLVLVPWVLLAAHEHGRSD
jgi:Protein of unknown function (DUF3040)